MAPSQLFDFSDFHAQNSFPLQKGAVEEGNDDENPPQLTEEAAKFARFDWNKWAHENPLEPLPELREILDDRAPGDLTLCHWLVEHLPVATLEILLSKTQKSVWNWLGDKKRAAFKTELFKGFQQTPALLKHPTIRARLFRAWNQTQRQQFVLLLHFWSQQKTAAPLLAVLDAQNDEIIVQNGFPSLVKTFEAEEILCALAWRGRVQLFKTIFDFFHSTDNSIKAIANAPVIENLVSASEKSENWEEKCALLQNEICQLRAQNATLRETNHSALAEAALAKKLDQKHTNALGKKLEHLSKTSEEKLSELRKNLERETRRLHAAQREIETLESEEKKLKKQFNRLQIHLADERKKVAGLEAQLAATQKAKTPNLGETPRAIEALSTPATTQKSKSAPVVVSSPTPLDETFRWNADGHQVRVTPREVRRLIDANDEDGVFRIIFALEAIEKRDPTTRNRFLTRLKDAGEYYPRVLISRTTPVLVDASNVARYEANRYGKGIFSNLLQMREELRRLGCFPIHFIADASLRYNVDEPGKFGEMVRENQIQVTPSGVEADEILTREARKTSAYVVTNDVNFHQKVSPDFAPFRISFRIFDGTVIVDDF